MDLSGLVTSFLTGTYTVTRTARASLNRGKAASGGSASTLTVRGSVSPATGKDLQRVPEGRRANAAMTLFTTTELTAGGVSAAYEADRVAINGASWEVSHVETWADPRSGGTIYRCVVTLVAS